MNQPSTDPRDPDGHVRNRRSLVLLSIGSFVGIALAASGALSPNRIEGLPADAIAAINQRTIPTDLYERARGMVAADKRNPMTEQDRQHVLRRLVEEELLIQRGEAIGLVASQPSVRKAIAASMIQSIVAESESEQPDQEALQRFYEENLGYFTPPGTLHVRQVLLRPREGESSALRMERGQAARRALVAGMPANEVQERFGDSVLLPIPDAPLPAHKLRQYVGPTLTQLVAALPAGGVSEVLESDAGDRVLQLVATTPGVAPSFEASVPQVEVAYRRDAADRALRDYLDALWQDADIRFAPGAPLP